MDRLASDKKVTLGEFLRNERERRGITVEQVASATKVGVKTLHALEADHFSELPAKPFIRGFIISYCRFINLDPKEVLAIYEDFINKKSIERPNRESGHSGYAFEKKDGEQQSRIILMIAIFGFVTLGGVAMFILKPSLRHRHSSHLERLRAAQGESTHSKNLIIPIILPSGIPTAHGASIHPLPTQPSTFKELETTSLAEMSQGSKNKTPEPASSNSKENQKDSLSQSQAESDSQKAVQAGGNPLDPLDSGFSLKPEEIKHKVILRVYKDVWVRYQVDGRPIRKFIMRKGKALVLRATEAIRFQASQPDAVKYSYNGHSFQSMVAEDKQADRQNDFTLFFPQSVEEKNGQPFPNEPLLKVAPAPEPKQISQ